MEWRASRLIDLKEPFKVAGVIDNGTGNHIFCLFLKFLILIFHTPR